MARRYGTFTPARKAAQRKAALASARKRKGKGRVRRTGASIKRRYQAGHSGPGAVYRRTSDYYNSKGYYAKNRKGKKVGKVRRGYRKANTVAGVSYPIRGGVVAASYVRNRSIQKRTAGKGRGMNQKRGR